MNQVKISVGRRCIVMAVIIPGFGMFGRIVRRSHRAKSAGRAA